LDIHRPALFFQKPFQMNPSFFSNRLLYRSLLGVAVLFGGLSAAAQCYVEQYPNYRRVLRVDGDYVLAYASYKRLFKFDGDYLLAYSSYKRLLKFDGDYIVRYDNYRRIARLDGQYLVEYPGSRRIARLDCPGRRSALAAAAYFLL
jgi:tetratricopeptide (TPR) repeat protein